MFDQIWLGTQVAFQWQNLLIALFGATAGIIIGGLPGLSATMGVALLIPVTFGMHPASGLIMLGAVYCGAIYGGSIAAILVRTPGTPAAAATPTTPTTPRMAYGTTKISAHTMLVAMVL